MIGGVALVGVSLVVAAADWAAVARRDKRTEFVLKPLTIVVLLAAAFVLRGGDETGRWIATVLALVASLAGDVFLMLREPRFIAGLAAFLGAHVAYAFAFATLAPDVDSAVALASVLAVGAWLFLRLRRGMRRSGQDSYAAPVAVYVLAIAAMVASALLTWVRPSWTGFEAALATAGALLFMSSDAMIGWSRFVREAAWMRVAIIVTYHVAQAALVLALLG